MDALILAAGFGSRLEPLYSPKPLAPLAGWPLIGLGLMQLRAAGVSRVVVALGHDAARIEAALGPLARAAGVQVETVRVPDHTRPNGYSVLAGAERIQGEYLLVMADHVFGPGILERLALAAPRLRRLGGGAMLAIDRRVADPRIDPEDATWTRLAADGRILAIGKALPRPDAVDCGAFLATPMLTDAIRTAIARGQDGTLSAGMQVLANARRAHWLDIGDAWWIDVDDPRAYALAEREVRSALPALFAPPGAAARAA